MPEAETIAVELGVRIEAVPLLSIVSVFQRRQAKFTLMNDNACLQNNRKMITKVAGTKGGVERLSLNSH